ncbi:cleavage and polyadenylation specificity factor subunit 2 [Sporothrix schenckii 1099-18]|uniref:Cleavage and polyadenylation specificity factor subunit 2 n=1 Tax=Sporothrix schenckii 1099-18 TaxID=1397361 RepID=A0A0F2M5P0_SPOSC|nr:cleavage and polyadenylation specificity factor subunit 2 [Sporothrix schenckii 1099-18]KJR83496.1 cleavage and polyadenylation specificity factor subunit 2 [Sporothrix schenckii 1099-18]
MFTFCPLQGARSESTASQSLLELDGGVKVLVDVGWDESFDAEKLRELEKQVPTISLVLLTHATVSHIAAFAYCCKNFPLFARIPIFATRPVIDLGRTLLQDLYASTPLAAAIIPRTSLAEVAYSYEQSTAAEHSRFLLPAPTPDEITRYFSLIRELKYSQPHQPQAPPNLPPLNGLTITAYNAGRTLGGTLWHIQLGLESIVYGVDWGQYKENVFAGAAWIGGAHGGGSEVMEQLRKPTALVSSSRAPQVDRPGLRDEHLLETIRTCVVRGGTVLIPVDSTARILELAYFLEHAWRHAAAGGGGSGDENLSRSKLYLAGRTSGSLVRHARTLLEWMNDSIVQEFEAVADGAKQANGRGSGGAGDDGKTKEAGPFDFRHMRLLERRSQVDRVLSQPPASGGGKVILASDASLEWGFSKEILRRIADDPQNLVVLTDVPGRLADDRPPSVARTLWEWWRDGSNPNAEDAGDRLVHGAGRPLEFRDTRKVALEGAELALYQQWLATQRQLQATQLSTAGSGGLGVSLLGEGGAGHLGGGMAALLEDGADDVSSESSSDSDDESDGDRQGKVLNVSTTIGQASRKKVVLRDEDLGVTILIKRKGHYDFDVRGKKGRERIFPVPVRRKRNDDFGELIRPDEYLREEEREEEAAHEATGGRNSDGATLLPEMLGRKRKWDDVGVSTGRGQGDTKRPNLDNSNRNGHHRGDSTDGKRRGRGGNGSDDEGGAADHDGGLYDSDVDGDDADDAAEAATTANVLGPAKLISTTETVPAWLRIGYVDYSGLHTARNLEILLPLVEPRKLILVGGSEAETAAVAAHYRSVVSTNRGVAETDVDVLLPRVGGPAVDASVDTHAWVVKLADALVKKLKWQNLRGLGIVTMTGQLRPGLAALPPAAANAPAASEESTADADHNQDADDASSAGANKRQKTDASGSALAVAAPSSAPSSAAPGAAPNAQLPTLDVLPSNVALAAARAGTQPLHVGELRLADLRRTMQASGHTAEFRGEGTLVIDGSVAVKKTTTGRVEVESIGLPSDGGPATKVGGTFYAVKRMIYDGLAVVAGG